MTKTEMRQRIIDYLERRDGGDMLRSIGMIAEGIQGDRTEVQELVKEMVRKGEVFEPIPRRYLRHERRLRSERRTASQSYDPDRRKTARRAGTRA